jgi:hypothetical protein
MRKVLTMAALMATSLTGFAMPASAQYQGNYGSGYTGRNNSGYADRDGYYRDRYGVMRDRYGNRVDEAADSGGADPSGFYVDARGSLRDRQGRAVTAARAERNGWYRDRGGVWAYGEAGYAENGYTRDRNGVLRDRNGNRVSEQTAYNGQTWVGDDGRTYCRKKDGTTGTIVGAVAGALLGNVIDGGRNRAAGTIVGGGAGALAGRSIERNSTDCR